MLSKLEGSLDRKTVNRKSLRAYMKFIVLIKEENFSLPLFFFFLFFNHVHLHRLMYRTGRKTDLFSYLVLGCDKQVDRGKRVDGIHKRGITLTDQRACFS